MLLSLAYYLSYGGCIRVTSSLNLLYSDFDLGFELGERFGSCDKWIYIEIFIDAFTKYLYDVINHDLLVLNCLFVCA